MTNPTASTDFIRDRINEDNRRGTYGGRVATRFPPEPNGYLHIGHAKSICLNFGLALDYGGTCNLRFDDTNPAKEDVEYVKAIQDDVHWLGFDFGPAPLYASDYFAQMYACAEKLIRDGKAYVCSLTEEQIRDYRGSLTEPGRSSPDRERPVADSLDLLARMKQGEFPDGTYTLRAKIDMAAANMKMRDPLLYRIRNVHHDRTGDTWHIYPMYDYAHPLSDAFEDITHSICTLEFENNRELYDWVIRESGVAAHPQQIEFARLNLDYTVMSKRKLLTLVKEGHVSGWDDPRMPTIAAMRRRGYSPQALRAFAELVGVAKNNSIVDIGKLEFCVRDDLNQHAPRILAVLDPLKVTLTNLGADETRPLIAPYFPADIGKPGEREVPLTRTLFIDRDDFAATPPKGYNRLAPGRVVRLRYAGCIRCDEVVTDDAGEAVELRCSYLPDTEGGKNPEGDKVWGVIHWVSATKALAARVRLYDRLFNVARPDAAGDGEFAKFLNPESLISVEAAWVEPSVATARPGDRFQFERLGYFCIDTVESRPEALVFNRIVTLRDSWSKAASAQPAAAEEGPRPLRSAKSATRPASRSKAEFRKEARARHPLLAERFAAYQAAHGLSEDDADLLTGDLAMVTFFDQALAASTHVEALTRWVINELPRALEDRELQATALTAAHFAAIVEAVEERRITQAAAKEVLVETARTGQAPDAIIADKGLAQVTDDAAIEALVDGVLAANPDKVEAFRGGKVGLRGFFVGQIMKASQGNANPAKVNAILDARLAG